MLKGKNVHLFGLSRGGYVEIRLVYHTTGYVEIHLVYHTTGQIGLSKSSNRSELRKNKKIFFCAGGGEDVNWPIIT